MCLYTHTHIHTHTHTHIHTHTHTHTHTRTYSQVELDSPSEMSEQYLMDEVHPKTQAYRPKFDRPKPPQRRAGKKK